MARVSTVILFAGLMVAAQIGSAQEPKKTGAAKKMADMMALAKGGPEHEQLAKYAGKWSLVVKMAGRPAMKCDAEIRPIIGRRFLEIRYTPTEEKGGTEGAFIVGFDRRHQHFTTIAMDDFGTYAVHSQGKADEKTGKIKMYGKDDDPMMKKMGFTKEFVHVLDLRGPDEFTIEVLFVDTRTPERKEIKSMEFVFRRKA